MLTHLDWQIYEDMEFSMLYQELADRGNQLAKIIKDHSPITEAVSSIIYIDSAVLLAVVVIGCYNYYCCWLLFIVVVAVVFIEGCYSYCCY